MRATPIPCTNWAEESRKPVLRTSAPPGAFSDESEEERRKRKALKAWIRTQKKRERRRAKKARAAAKAEQKKKLATKIEALSPGGSLHDDHIARVYGQRNALLRVMGYATYADYLKGALWASIRYRVLNRDCHQCRFCDGPAREVHHMNYKPETMLGENIDALASICRACHETAEITNGKKNTLYVANSILQRMLKRQRQRDRRKAS